MTQPAIIIGLGGTGQWILTYLKKDLLELNGGRMPDNVRLLAFDTVSTAEAETQVVNKLYTGDQAAYEKSRKRVGTVELDPDTELIHLGGDCRPLGEAISKGKHPHLAWFDAAYWLKTLQAENWYLDRGAGRFRQFGLLAIYQDLLNGRAVSKILTHLPAAIDAVSGQAGGNSFDLIVVSSIAGGTGSAMTVPFGVMARSLFPAGAQVRARSLIVLPTAFSASLKASRDLALRGQAALRELARAMMPPEGYQTQVEFLPGDPQLGKVTFSRPFDEVFFVDGTRNGAAINTNPKYAVFPASAAWIRNLLDDTVGQWYSHFVTANRAGSQVNNPKKMTEGVFTVFGIHSKYAPERTLGQTYELKLADRLLTELVNPVPEGPGGRLIPKVPSQKVTASEMARSLLSQTAKYGDTQHPVTLFHSAMARILNSGGKNSNEEVNKKANAGVAGKGKRDMSDGWFTDLTDLPLAPEYDALRNKVSVAKGANFHNKFRASDAFNPPRDPGSAAVYQDLTGTLNFWLNENFGGMGADGPDDYGFMAEVAKECVAAQINIFKSVLKLRMLSLLSESTGRGRLGYAINILTALESDLKAFQDFLAEVSRTRSTLATLVDLRRAVQDRQSNWMKQRGEKPTLLEKIQNKYSEKAVTAERAYIKAQGDLANYIREEALAIQVAQAVKGMLEFTSQSRIDLERWVAILLEGDTAQDLSGLLSRVRSELAQVTTNIHEDQRASEVEELVQVNSRESQVANEDVQWALAGLQWEAKAGRGLEFSLMMAPQGEVQGQLRMPQSGDMIARRSIEEDNSRALSLVLGQRFGQAASVIPILKWSENNKPNHTQFAQSIVNDAAPLTSLVVGYSPTMQAAFITMNKFEDPNGYAQKLESALQTNICGKVGFDAGRPVQVLDSEDPYRLTVARAYTGLMLEEFATWDECKAIYESELDKADNADPERLKQLMRSLQCQYTQPEEKAAIELEVQLASRGARRRAIHPRVVSLLGDKHKLELALQAWTLGWVEEADDKIVPGKAHWLLKVPGWEQEFWITPNADKGSLAVLDVLEAFVLVGRNHSRDNQGMLRWNELRQAIMGAKDLLRQAAESAVTKEGLYGEWLSLAVENYDSVGNLEYRVPAYVDLAEYARRYYQTLV